MEPPKPPDQLKHRPMSYAEASKGANNGESAKPPDSRRRSMSHADAPKEKELMTDSELPARAWPSSRVEGIADKASQKLDVDDTAKVAHKMVSLKSPKGGKPAMSYADITRKNIPVHKQPKRQASRLETRQETRQASEVDKTKLAVSTAPATPTQRASSTPELLPAIENAVRSTEITAKSASPKPLGVPGRDRAPLERLPETTTDMAQQIVRTTEPPRKNRLLTWAGVASGQRSAVMPPLTPRLQPGAPVVQPSTSQTQIPIPGADDPDSPIKKSIKSGKGSKTSARQKTKENSQHKTPGLQEARDGLHSPTPTRSKSPRKKPQTPSQPGKRVTTAKQSPSKRDVGAPRQPGVEAYLSSSDVAPSPKFAPITDRSVPIYPSGNLAATLKRRQEVELATKRLTASVANQLPTLTTAWTSQSSHAASLPERQQHQAPAKIPGTASVPVSFPPLNTSWPALPTVQAKIDNTRYVNTSQFENNNMRGQSPTPQGPVDQHTIAAINEIQAKKERERSAMRRGIPKTNAK
ncbi:hypothetical protein BR93DRAFT_762916 [Coniochaeta sp. PMI_546]|nr:hypothetical protein BR93DRAFT_762916 [Coniochaeta sp. PMI_546]